MKRIYSIVLTILGAILLFGAVASYFYYETSPISEHFQWTVASYPLRQYTLVLVITGIALLILGALLPETRKPKEDNTNIELAA